MRLFNSDGNRRLTARKAGVAAAAAVGIPLLFGAATLYNVSEGQTAVKLTGGQITDVTGPGWHFRIPIYQSYRVYNTGKLSDIQMKGLNIYYSPDVEAASTTSTAVRTGQDLAAANAQQYTIHEITARYTSAKDHVRMLHSRYQSESAIERFVVDQITETYKAVIRKIDPLKINVSREIVGEETRRLVQKRIDEIVGVKGAIVIDSIIFRNFDFEKNVAAAFEKANGERAGIQAENFAREREAVRVQREKLAGEAEGARAIEVAIAQAKVIKLEGEALAANPSVLQLRMIEAWKAGARVPQVVTGANGGSPFIYSLPPMTEDGPKAAVAPAAKPALK